MAVELDGLGIEWLRRDPKLSSNSVGANQLLLNEIAQVPPAQNYFMLNCCTPLIRAETIRECVLAFNESAHDSVITVVPFAEYLWSDGQPNYDLDRLPNSAELPSTLMETHALYGIRRESLLKLRRRIGCNVMFFRTRKTEAIDINNEEDLLIASAIWQVAHEHQ